MSDNPADPAREPLEYAQRPAVSRRWLLRGTLLGVIVALAIAGYPWRRDLTAWASLVRIRHRALNHEMPPGTVVMTQKPDDTRETWGNTIPARYAANDPAWRDVENRLVPSLPASPGSSVTLFLHGRTSPKGNRRVVAINVAPSWFREGPRVSVDVRLFDPGSLRNPRFRELSVKETKDLRVRGHIPAFPACFAAWRASRGVRTFASTPAAPIPRTPHALRSTTCTTARAARSSDVSTTTTRSRSRPRTAKMFL